MDAPQAPAPSIAEQSDAPILRLPNELLVQIFEASVDATHNPLAIAQVCHLWRDLALQTSSLWRIIDLTSLGRAKYHLELARDSHLHIVWFDRHGSGVTLKLEKYGWIWSRASRFSQLHLAIPSKIITHIFASMGVDLPELLELTIVGFDVHFPSILAPRMPRLRKLTLTYVLTENLSCPSHLTRHGSNFQACANDITTMLRNSPLLEEIDFVKLSLPVLMQTPPDFFHLPRLKKFTLASMGTLETQAYLLCRIQLPKQCQLVVVGTAARHGHRQLLHSSTIASLTPVRFTSVSIHPLSVEYDEGVNDSRCSLKLKLSQSSDVDGVIDPAQSLDMSHVTDVHLHYACLGPQTSPDVLFILQAVAPSIRTITLHARAISSRNSHADWLNHSVFDNCRRLEALVCQEIDLSYNSSLDESAPVDMIARFLSKQGALRGERLRLRLCDCKVAEEGLDVLRQVSRVEEMN